MKRLMAIWMVMFLLTGCSENPKEIERAMELREKILSSKGCGFQVSVLADYPDMTFRFQMRCQSDSEGNLEFQVVKPDSIGGICGNISASEGVISFDETVLAFPLLTEEELTPISAPWVMLNALRGGYIVSGNYENDLLRLTLNDSYESEALQVDIWMDNMGKPVYAEIFWKERRVLSIEVDAFDFL